MKLSRRLIPAFAMLLVSAVLMSTASFAWFTMNNEVTADGMQVTATASSSLVIRATTSASPDFTNEATFTVAEGKDKLYPTTTFDGKSFGKLGTVLVTNPNSYAASFANPNAPTTTELTQFTSATTGFDSYVQKATYQVKSVGGDADVFVKSITVTLGEGQAAGLLNAVRVAVCLGDPDAENATWYIYQPNKDATVTNPIQVPEYTAAVAGTDGAAGTDASWTMKDAVYSVAAPAITPTQQGAAAATKIGSLTYDASNVASASSFTQLTIYVWIEGQDPACTSNNAAVDSDFAVSVVFGAEFPEAD